MRVAVIDSGCDVGHPDLLGAVDPQASVNLVGTSSSLEDRNGHGTHIAGIIAGRGASHGVAPEATLIVYKVCDGPMLNADYVTQGIMAAVESGADIINLSLQVSPRYIARRWSWPRSPWVWGTPTIFDDAIDYATSKGVLCVVAAGNHPQGLFGGTRYGTVSMPAGLESVLAVGSHNAVSGKTSAFSGRGPLRLEARNRGQVRHWKGQKDQGIVELRKPDLVAPGENIGAACSRQIPLGNATPPLRVQL